MFYTHLILISHPLCERTQPFFSFFSVFEWAGIKLTFISNYGKSFLLFIDRKMKMKTDEIFCILDANTKRATIEIIGKNLHKKVYKLYAFYTQTHVKPAFMYDIVEFITTMQNHLIVWLEGNLYIRFTLSIYMVT